MLKQHNITNLKYLCFHHGTTNTCYTYNGSGIYWCSHLSKHGKDITTTILLESDNRCDIATAGVLYSKLWDVVNSTEFANLTVEDAQTTAGPLQRPEVRQKRNMSFKNRIKLHGLTDKEKKAKEQNAKLLQRPEIRVKAANTLRTRLTIGQTDKEKQRGKNKMHRIKTKGFTEREISSHQQTRERQSGKTMRERLGDINYIDPRKGKSATEIQGDAYVGPWNKGRTITELKGQNYVDPRCKPFTITSHLGVHEYKNEREFLTATNFASPLLTKLKRIGKYTVKRQSNTLHPFEHGETILYNTL